MLELRQKIATEAQERDVARSSAILLRQQMQAIQQELGENDPERPRSTTCASGSTKADLPDDVRKEAERELDRLERLPGQRPDYQVIRTWLEFVLELPWNKSTEDNLDLARAAADARRGPLRPRRSQGAHPRAPGVLKLNPKAKAPILCFVGPPGVGKTSLGQSIARALGRKFERMSLGGLHDEAELRGHRRTYIGAMPGRIIQAIRRAGVSNPVLMLDEVDKLGRDFRGDPAAALLEVLDPAQNNTFRDNYLDLPFDLSKVFFITTANTLDTIPRPLLDRMEVLRLSGYSEEEKIADRARYLIPRQLDRDRADRRAARVPRRRTLQGDHQRYTREAGVRELERGIGRLARKVALQLRRRPHRRRCRCTPTTIVDLLGPERFLPEQARKDLPPGVATGLAWTETGGDVLYIEAHAAARRQGPARSPASSAT